MRQKGFVLFPLVIIVVLLGAVGYLVYQNTQLQKSSGNLNSTSVTPSGNLAKSSSTPDPTAEWETFNNGVYYFKYPITWDTCLIGENMDYYMVGPKEKVDKVRPMKGGFGGGTFLTLTIGTSTEQPAWTTDENWKVASEPIEVNGVSGTKYSVSVLQDGPGFSAGDKITNVVLKHDDKFIQIELLDQTYQDIYEQILSTFKFLQ